MISMVLLQEILNTILEDNIEDVEFNWKNKSFSPKQNKPWIKAVFIPTNDNAITLGDNGHNQVDGMYQISVFTGRGTGSKVGTTTLDKLRELFKIGLHFTVPDDHKFWITHREYSYAGQTSLGDFGKGGIEDNWNCDFMTVFWSAREPRNS